VHLLVVDNVIAVEINKWYAAKNWLSWALCRTGYQGPYVGIAYQGPFVGDNPGALLDAAIARTCRLSIYETYPIIYGQNVFSFYDWGHMYYFERAGTSNDSVQQQAACSPNRTNAMLLAESG